MKEISQLLDTEEMAKPVNRRAFLTRAAVTGLGVVALGMGLTQEASAQPRMQGLTNEAQFRQALLGLGTLSLVTSQIALNKASNSLVREFAGFEAGEQTALGNVLRDMNTPVPTLTANLRAIVANLRSLSRGAAFDRAYINAQYNTHVQLRDLNESFLSSANGRSMPTRHTRHISTLALATIKEHVAITRRLSQALRA